MKKLFLKITLLSFLGFMAMGLLTPLHYSTLEIVPTAQATETVHVPVIPKPDLLPGPSEDESGRDVQEYFRDTAIPTFINGFLGLIAGLALLALIYSGIRFLTSYGEEEGLTEAKRIALWSIAGFVITLLAYAVVSIINTLAFPEGSYEQGSQEQVTYEDI